MAKFAIVPFSTFTTIGSWSAGTYCSKHRMTELDGLILKAHAVVEQAKLRVLRLGIERSNLTIRDELLKRMGVKLGN